MANKEIERLLNEIGQILSDHISGSNDPVLLFAEVDTNMVGPDVFIERFNDIEYQWADDRFTYPLLDLWEEEKPGKRWAEIEYVLRDGKFDVTFNYPDQLDPNEDSLDRRDRVVRRHFGDKPIVYPSFDDDDDDAQRFEL